MEVETILENATDDELRGMAYPELQDLAGRLGLSQIAQLSGAELVSELLNVRAAGGVETWVRSELEKIPMDRIEGLSQHKTRELARRLGLQSIASLSSAAIVSRLLTLRAGGLEALRGQTDLCLSCGARLSRRSPVVRRDAEGDRVIGYKVRCRGPRLHNYRVDLQGHPLPDVSNY